MNNDSVSPKSIKNVFGILIILASPLETICSGCTLLTANINWAEIEDDGFMALVVEDDFV